jgi:hypothetical protein
LLAGFSARQDCRRLPVLDRFRTAVLRATFAWLETIIHLRSQFPSDRPPPRRLVPCCAPFCYRQRSKLTSAEDPLQSTLEMIMVIRSLELAQPSEFPSGKPLLASLLENLGNEDATTLRQLTRLVKPPIDACRIDAVISSISAALNYFRDATVQGPAVLTDNCASVARLNTAIAAQIRTEVSAAQLDRPLLRSLRQHSAWALFLALYDGKAVDCHLNLTQGFHPNLTHGLCA